MRRRWRCKVEEEYLDLWTSEEGRCGGDGDGGGVAFSLLAGAGRGGRSICFLPTHTAPTRKCSPPRPNPLASKPVTTYTNGSSFKNPPQNLHLTPPH